MEIRKENNGAFGREMPEGWKETLLDQLTKRGSGHTPDKAFPEYYNGGIKWISLSDSYRLDNGLIEESDSEISELGIKKSSAVLHQAGTVIMSRDAGVGKSAVMAKNMAVSQHFITWTCKEYLNNWYLYYWLQFKKQFFERQAVGSTIKTIGLPLFKKLTITHPPLPEQHAIADYLSTWDTAIQKTTQLIAQKEQRKKWLMQQLLTGKKRLKGFEGAWKEVRMKDVFKEIKASNDGEIGHIVMTISSKLGLVSQEDKFDRVIAGDSLRRYTQLKRFDFAYNKGNSKTYQMGCVYQLEEKQSALVPFVYICFSPTEKVHSTFYKHWFYGHGLDRQLKKIISSGARGDGLLNVNSDDFFNLKIPLPSVAEQTAIAHILQTADQEIQLLKAQVAKMKEQKKGMMQVLLTGKKRLKL